MSIFLDSINESIKIKKNLISLEKKINFSIDKIYKCLKNKNKVLTCGNGGSAADAQHLAAEMLVRLRPKNNREGVPAISLAQDVSTITACGNDFGYDVLFERNII